MQEGATGFPSLAHLAVHLSERRAKQATQLQPEEAYHHVVHNPNAAGEAHFTVRYGTVLDVATDGYEIDTTWLTYEEATDVAMLMNAFLFFFAEGFPLDTTPGNEE